MSTSRLTNDQDIISIRVPRSLTTAIKTIASREAETAATVWRRLVKRGLAEERRSSHTDEAA